MQTMGESQPTEPSTQAQALHSSHGWAAVSLALNMAAPPLCLVLGSPPRGWGLGSSSLQPVSSRNLGPAVAWLLWASRCPVWGMGLTLVIAGGT